MKKTLLLVLAVAVVVGGGAFYSGMKYSQSKVSQRFAQIGGNGGNFRSNRTSAGGNSGFIAGEILSKDADSITVKMRDGSSKIIFFSDSTEIGKFVNGASNDLSIGQSISVSGKANSDGSITAQSIQIRPNMPSPSPAK